jgi:hypothetical protein
MNTCRSRNMHKNRKRRKVVRWKLDLGRTRSDIKRWGKQDPN